jgi:hypothetical protein
MPQGALYTIGIGGLSGGFTVKLVKKVIFHPFNPFFGQFPQNFRNFFFFFSILGPFGPPQIDPKSNTKVRK